jgi:hypothetical protein
MTREEFGPLVGYLLVAAVVLALVYGVYRWERAIWDECRASGRSVPYCLRMVAR